LLIALMSPIASVGWAEYDHLRFVNADEGVRILVEPDVDQRLRATEQLGTLLRHSRISSVPMDKSARPVGMRGWRIGEKGSVGQRQTN
jgi:poly-beta-1,6-N-acetyl-D-glucosamine biosynthesis protein PgaD